MVLYSWICPALCHTAIQEEDPADPTGDPTYTEHTWGDENIRSPTTRQVARHHIRLETLIQTTRTTPGKPKSGRSRMPANAREHERRAKPPEHEDIVQRLCISSAIIRSTSMVERQETTNTKNRNYTK